MNKLWYEIKKLSFLHRQRIQIQIDTRCKLCYQSLENFKKHPLRKDDVIIILPNVNSHGKITSYHIGRTLRCHIKETKIYKDLIESDKE